MQPHNPSRCPRYGCMAGVRPVLRLLGDSRGGSWMLSNRYRIAFFLVAAVAGCGTDGTPATAPEPDPRPAVLLKDIVIPRLPSPYYHFAYDPTGRMTNASFASDLTSYTLSY